MVGKGTREESCLNSDKLNSAQRIYDLQANHRNEIKPCQIKYTLKSSIFIGITRHGFLKTQLASACVHETFKPRTINKHCCEHKSIQLPYLGYFEIANGEQMLFLPCSPKDEKSRKWEMDLDVAA